MKKRPRIGFLCTNLVGDYHRKQWSAINNTAIKNDVHLIMFSPFMFYSHYAYRSDYFKTFEIAHKENVDGLILSAGSLKIFYEKEKILSFCKALSPLPVVMIAEELEGIPAVLIDNKQGMKDLVNHFIRKHNYEHIAFIKGPPDNQDARDRFSGYKKALEENGIPFNEDLVIQGDYSLYSGKTAACELFNNKQRFRAVVAANDDMLLGVFSEIQSRGLLVPGDIALGGFDDIEIVKSTDPPISTVTQPFVKQATKATEMIINLIHGNRVPEKINLAARPIIRESCGCKAQPGRQDKVHEKKNYRAADFAEKVSPYKFIDIGYNVGYITVFSTYIMNALSIETTRKPCQTVLMQLEIPSCYISFYKNGMPLLSNNDKIPPASLESFLMYRDTKIIPIDKSKRIYETNKLIPDEEFFEQKRRTLVCSELIFRKEHYGIIFFELAHLDPLVFHLLKLQFTNCLQYLYIHNELDKAYSKLKGLDKAKTQFFVNISHELRTPLTLLLAPLESLLEGEFGNSIKENAGLFRSMLENGTRLLQLINNLLDFSKIEAGKMVLKKQNINISRLIHSYMNSIHAGAKGRGISVHFRNHSEDDIISSIDQGLLEKAFFNLVSNALKFTPKKGEVIIGLHSDSKVYSISIQDTGIGIPSDKLDIIFDRFTQGDGSMARKYKGTGIGLAFAKQIVELHGGTIKVVSQEGKGSIFTMHLPFDFSAKDEPVIEPEVKDTGTYLGSETDKDLIIEVHEPVESDTEKRKVLVVEDTPVMRGFIKKLLVDEYTVYTAENGQQGYEYAEKYVPDIIISDILMPVVDGYKLITMLKKNPGLRDIPVILLSAKSDIIEKEPGSGHDADDYLSKPFNARELRARIAIHLKMKTFFQEKTDAIEKLNRTLTETMAELKRTREQLNQYKKSNRDT